MSHLAVLLLAAFPFASWAQPAPRSWPADLSKHSIDLNELVAAGVKKDDIPSIDHPKFVSPQAAAQWMSEDEPVIVIALNDEVRAYPLQILIWHLLVNDQMGNTPILVSYSVLCHSAMVFDRRVNGKVYDFGFSGMVRDSNLVMFDRQTDSLWQQLTGAAIAGSLTGTTLTMVPSQLAPFHVFSETYPNGKVLSRETGYQRHYGQNPYARYIATRQLLFPVHLPGTLPMPAMEKLVIVEAGEYFRAYSFAVINQRQVTEGKIGDQNFVIFPDNSMRGDLDTPLIANSEKTTSIGVFSANLDGKKLSFQHRNGAFFDKQTRSTWNVLGVSTGGPMTGKHLKTFPHRVSFAFAWLALRPDTPVVMAPRIAVPEVGQYIWPPDEETKPASRTSPPSSGDSNPFPQ